MDNNLNESQKRLFIQFIEIFGDNKNIKPIEQLIEIIEKGTINRFLEDVATINAAYNGDNDKISIKEMLDAVEKFDGIYRRFFDIENGENRQSSALIEIEEAAKYAPRIKSDYQRFYNQTDSQENTSEGIVTKLEKACSAIEENQDKIARFEAFYERVFVDIGTDESGNDGRLSLENYLNTKQTEIEKLISEKTQDSYYLCSALNTPMALFYLEQVYTKLDNTGWQWKKDPLEKIPIPKITESNKHIADGIIELTKRVHLQRDENLEKQIRECFYEIYSFNDEERKFFEINFLTKGDI